MYSMKIVLRTGNSDGVGRPKYCLPGNLNMTVFFHILVVIVLSIKFSPLNATEAHYEGEGSYLGLLH